MITSLYKNYQVLSSKEATSVLCFVATGWHFFAAFSLWQRWYCSEQSPSVDAAIKPLARAAAAVAHINDEARRIGQGCV